MPPAPSDLRFPIIFRSVFDRLPPRIRRRLVAFIALGVLNAVMETLSVGAIAVFAASIVSPGSIAARLAQLSSHLPFLGDRIDFGDTTSVLVAMGVCLVMFVAAKNIARSCIIYNTSRFMASIDTHFGATLVEGLLRMPYAWHLRQNPSDLVTGTLWQTYFGTGMLSSMNQLISDLCMVALLLGTLLLVQPLVTLSTLSVLALLGILVAVRVNRKLDGTVLALSEQRRFYFRHLGTIFNGIKDLLISGRTETFRATAESCSQAIARLSATQKLITDLPTQLLETFGIGLLVSTIMVLLLGAGADQKEVGGAIALLAVASLRLLPAASRIVSGTTTLRSTLPYVDSSLKYLDTIDELAIEHETEAPAPVFQETLELRDIHFTYGIDPVLRGVSLAIRKGEVLGIIGRSGAGKSTLADIVMGLLTPTQGEVLLDGSPLPGELAQAWRHRVGYVPQAPYIMDGTQAENVAFGEPRPDRDRVLRSCALASIDYLDTLEDGMDTMLGERGLRLSGGQRQRIAIARALYNDPPLVVFDEATSSLDEGHEKIVQDTILGLRGNRTLILIAHRLKTLECCDRLAWIEDGALLRLGAPGDILPRYAQTLQEERSAP